MPRPSLKKNGERKDGRPIGRFEDSAVRKVRQDNVSSLLQTIMADFTNL